MEETLDILSDPTTMARVRQGQAELAAGRGLDEAQLREFLDRSRR
ncbi:MAG: hypothetical protein ACR2HM_08235 [Acidimicrobiales bacterium]